MTDVECGVAGKTIGVELDLEAAAALDELASREERPRTQIATVALKTFLEIAATPRLALFAIDGLATEDERAAAMALIGQSAIDAYQGKLAAAQAASRCSIGSGSWRRARCTLSCG